MNAINFACSVNNRRELNQRIYSFANDFHTTECRKFSFVALLGLQIRRRDEGRSGDDKRKPRVGDNFSPVAETPYSDLAPSSP